VRWSEPGDGSHGLVRCARCGGRLARGRHPMCRGRRPQDENDETLNLREGPSTHAPVVRALDNGTEVTIGAPGAGGRSSPSPMPVGSGTRASSAPAS